MIQTNNKPKKNLPYQKKRRVNWNQRLQRTPDEASKPTRLKKSLQYIFLIRKFKNTIDFKNVKLLKAFLTKYGKIKPRVKTRISIQNQRSISKAIRKARIYGLIPFTCDVKI